MSDRNPFHSKILKHTFIFLIVAVTAGFAGMPFFLEPDDPKVVYVYTRKGSFPEWLFRLSAVPLAWTSLAVYRRPALYLAPAASSEIQKAFAQAEFLIIGVHGRNGKFQTDDGFWVEPRGPRYPKARFVYFGACDIGRKIGRWQDIFPHAVIKSYDGYFAPWQGGLYVVFQAWWDLLKTQSNAPLREAH